MIDVQKRGENMYSTHKTVAKIIGKEKRPILYKRKERENVYWNRYSPQLGAYYPSNSMYMVASKQQMSKKKILRRNEANV